MASMKAGRSRGVSALRTVGSFRVTVAMPSVMSTMTASFSVILASPNSGCSAVLAGEERAGAVDVDQGIDIEMRRYVVGPFVHVPMQRSEEHTSELQSLMRISYAVVCLNKKKINSSQAQNHA